ncbi:BamA/TamA family outer membrane protein [Flammeovirga yaeyamensis]|uniref:BamA/TamA family outer membrane protein n=1 Tax=Flammeovirga yaeyamensis TaxID=367791 RepID=A0AAX1NA25_9BACT|nr:BamA/TamA family outer membrane protein [Flammeovirga yaeyamensis]MBB3699282.1 hypothetical protein [Flammeovirga yaeyamensis]NMF35455.1 BamA/TamA family outer membrane protein [Flammeovirga yaeyamensis]QWG04315.1 BamA/TamA family outer membrane protein [Flammeovirga yaeyamensis]
MKSRLWFTILFLNCIANLLAQEKVQQDSLKDKNFVDKLIDIVTYDSKSFSMTTYPLGGYSEQFGFMIGAMPVFTFAKSESNNNDKYKRPTTLIPSILVSSKGLFSTKASLIFYGKEHLNLQIDGIYQYVPFNYYGVNELTPADTVSFFNRQFASFGEATYEMNDIYFLGFRYDIQYNKLEDFDQIINENNIIGLNGGFNFGIGPTFKIDNRNDVNYPSKGQLLSVALSFYPKFLGNDYHFSHFFIEYSKFFKIRSDKNILGFFAAFHAQEGDVPFYYLNKLGGSKRMRNIVHPLRFIDKNYYMTQLEYRRHLFWRLGMVLYGGVGNVYGSKGTSAFENVKYCVGSGFRFQLVDGVKVNFRFDYAIGNYDQQGFWITRREAF